MSVPCVSIISVKYNDCHVNADSMMLRHILVAHANNRELSFTQSRARRIQFVCGFLQCVMVKHTGRRVRDRYDSMQDRKQEAEQVK